MEGKKESPVQGSFEMQLSRLQFLTQVSRPWNSPPGLFPLPLGFMVPPLDSSFCPLGLWLHLCSPSFFMKMVLCSWVVLSAYFLTVKFWGYYNRSSVPFHLRWQCFCWYKILKNFVGLVWISWGFMLPFGFLKITFSYESYSCPVRYRHFVEEELWLTTHIYQSLLSKSPFWIICSWKYSFWWHFSQILLFPLVSG